MGWGASVKGQELRKSGHWSWSKQEMHINYLEVLVAFLAIRTFAKQMNINILVRTHNISARAYINHFRGDSLMANEFISNADMEVVCRVIDFPNNTTPSRGRMQLFDLLLDTCHLLFG